MAMFSVTMKSGTVWPVRAETAADAVERFPGVAVGVQIREVPYEKRNGFAHSMACVLCRVEVEHNLTQHNVCAGRL
jgi:hypothetical protein